VNVDVKRIALVSRIGFASGATESNPHRDEHMKTIAASAAILLISACAPMVEVPQSRNEYKASIGAVAGSKAEIIVVNRSYGTVLAVLEQRATNCFNKTFTEQVVGPSGGSIGTTTWRSSLEKITARQAELTVQIRFSPAGGVKTPRGGFYVLAADISEPSSGRTSVTLYGAIEGPYADTYRVTKAWIEGRDVTCPKLVGER